jgi:hypothetical protein
LLASPTPTPGFSGDSEVSDGVTTGFIRFSVEQVRSFEDRLGKAARKAANGDATTAWLAVGRVMGEMRSIREAQE